MTETLNYYAQNAEIFAEGTAQVDFSATCDRFLSYLGANGRILDFGCGAGRDTRYFLSKGFRVDAVDGSAELCAIAQTNTGIPVTRMLFQELASVEKYEGIWACASILHVSKAELPDIFRRMITAVKKNGIIYTSFKYGNFEGMKNGRFFSYFTEDEFRSFMKQFHELTVKELWISGDVRPERGDEKWLNILLQKTGIL